MCMNMSRTVNVVTLSLVQSMLLTRPYSPRSLSVPSSSVLCSSDVDVMYSCSVYGSALYIPVQICVLYCCVVVLSVCSCKVTFTVFSVLSVVVLCSVVKLLADIPAQRQTANWLGGMWRHLHNQDGERK